MLKSKVYFPGLNGLRFFAAAAVIISHVELLKGHFGYQHHWNHPVINLLGSLGVYFFFVLSGFLITYLLMKEKEVTKTVSVKNFYWRRIFRIWPLYYLVLVLGFFILPHINSIDVRYLDQPFHDNFMGNLWLYLLVLPNLAYAIFGAVPHIGQAWSIGVEEQFYLIWPVLMKKTKKVLPLLLILGTAIVLFKAAVLLYYNFHPNLKWLLVLKNFLAMSKIECMVVGGIGAYLVFSGKEKLLNWMYKPYVHLCCWLFIPFLIIYSPPILQDGIHLLFAMLFTVIIINVSCNINSFLKLENRVFNELGKISYGIYMYHMMLIPFVLLLFKPMYKNLGDGYTINVLLYSSVFIVTILISYLSYHYMESFFISMKKKYTAIASGGE